MPDNQFQFYRPTDLNFNPSAVDIKSLMQLAQAGQKPATKQQASTNPQGGIDPNIMKTFGGELGRLIEQYRQQAQRYGVGQQPGVAGQPGPIATPPTPGSIVPQQLQPMPQQPGPPMNILPQGYGQ